MDRACPPERSFTAPVTGRSSRRPSEIPSPCGYPELKIIEKPKKKLSDAVERFNAANDAVNAVFIAAEACLEKMGFEIDAFVTVYSRQVAPEHFGQAESEYPVDIVDETYLAYERVGDRFRITVHKERSTVVDEEISTSVTVLPHIPWDNVSQQEKLSALAKLPDLFEALASKVELQAELAEKESATVHAFVSRVS